MVLRDIKYYDSYGIYLAAQQRNKLTQFPVSANIATGLREAHTNLMFSLAILVLEYSTARNNAICHMFQCTECYLTKTELGIRFQ